MFTSITIAAAGILAGTTAEPPLPPHLSDLSGELLQLHNAERRKVGAAPLIWDEGLAADASGYARNLGLGPGILVHASFSQRKGQGENLWMGSLDRYSLARMFDGWAREKRLFKPGTFPNVGRNVPWEKVGHYTQIIWPETRRLGCGIRQAGRWDYLVCRYSPAGNVTGRILP